MSINTLCTNQQILKNLGEVLPAYLPSSGITSIVNSDNNLSVTGSDIVTINFEDNIEISGNSNFKGKIALNGSYGNINEVLTSQGPSTNPIWSNIGTGVTSVSNTDNNISISNVDGAVTLNLEDTITISQNLNVTNNLDVSGLILLSSSSGTSGNVLTSQGPSTNPIWAPLPSQIPELLKNISISTSQLPALTGTSVVIYNNSISGFTVGKTSIFRINFTAELSAGVATTFNMVLSVDGNPLTVTTYIDTSNTQGRSVVFTYIATNTTQAVMFSLEQVSTPVTFTVNTYNYISMQIMEIQ